MRDTPPCPLEPVSVCWAVTEFYKLMEDEDFAHAITYGTYGTNGVRQVRKRFEMAETMFE